MVTFLENREKCEIVRTCDDLNVVELKSLRSVTISNIACEMGHCEVL